eukprot:CAMPEP_0206063644 /NCGR_PEP_ID=MMETSP1466-20131121/58332_1 /ASSEMBLY_ACC=CAM_ASM_001126 /TAXON_ID=44452 /ORGANISM="Pavlova gyrans, Strain CCMP608" /LENGTH=558 /DNA_ID=CAMNT_0053439015 /DNA_START=1 /DNA_END=1677 /DNA_ORIENTATION=-
MQSKDEKQEASEKLKSRFRKIRHVADAIGSLGVPDDARARRVSLPPNLESLKGRQLREDQEGTGETSATSTTAQGTPGGSDPLRASVTANERHELIQMGTEGSKQRLRRHSALGAVQVRGRTAVEVHPASPSPDSKRFNRAKRSSFVQALDKALQPKPIFRSSSGGASDQDVPREERAEPAEQSLEAFKAVSHPIDAKKVVVMVSVGRVTRDYAAGVRAAARATTGLDVAVLEPVLSVRRRHKTVFEDVVDVAQVVTQRAVKGQDITAKIYLILVLAGEPLDRPVTMGITRGTANVVVIPCAPEDARDLRRAGGGERRVSGARDTLPVAVPSRERRASGSNSLAPLEASARERRASGSLSPLEASARERRASNSLAPVEASARERRASGSLSPLEASARERRASSSLSPLEAPARDRRPSTPAAPVPAIAPRRPSMRPTGADLRKVVHHTQCTLGRIIGIDPCVKYACAFAAFQEDVNLDVCPSCLRKLLWATPQTLDAHYAAQRDLQAAAKLGDARDRRLSADQQRLYGYLASGAATAQHLGAPQPAGGPGTRPVSR